MTALRALARAAARSAQQSSTGWATTAVAGTSGARFGSSASSVYAGALFDEAKVRKA